MNKYKVHLIILTIVLFFISCEDNSNKEEIGGCTDPSALNYDPNATADNDSCLYECPDNSSFILISTSKGLTWQEKCSFKNVGSMIIDISVIDTNNIWVCSAYPAKIVHISDGGRSWNTQYFDSTKTMFFNYIEMFDKLRGIAMGDGHNDIPLILRTENGGQTWTEVSSAAIGEASGDQWRRIDFLDMDNGYFRNCCNSPQLLYKTTDGGVNWTPTNYSGGIQVFKFYNEDIGLVIEGEDQVHRTIDGGQTWNSFNTSHVGWGMDIEFSASNPANIWILANGVYFSADTGKTWQIQSNNLHGRNILIIEEEGWVLKSLTLYHSQSAINGNWELLSFVTPENGQNMDAFGGNDQVLVLPGTIDE